MISNPIFLTDFNSHAKLAGLAGSFSFLF